LPIDVAEAGAYLKAEWFGYRGVKMGQITVNGACTSFVGRDAVEVFRLRVIASGLRLYAKTGIKPNRAYTPSAMLAAAEQVTGKKYKRGAYEAAAADIDVRVAEMMTGVSLTVER
jgi:hypothetical protein